MTLNKKNKGVNKSVGADFINTPFFIQRNDFVLHQFNDFEHNTENRQVISQ